MVANKTQLLVVKCQTKTLFTGQQVEGVSFMLRRSEMAAMNSEAEIRLVVANLRLPALLQICCIDMSWDMHGDRPLCAEVSKQFQTYRGEWDYPSNLYV